MLRIANNPTLKGLAVFCPQVTYSTMTGVELKMDMLLPQTEEGDETSRFPLVVFIQGSAWHFPDTTYEIPQLAQLAAAGYVVATVTHRNIDDGYPAPAFLQDVKTAIRYLRTNAAAYHIDPERVYSFGTSSGGNTSLLLGLTGDMEEFRTEEYPDVSDSVGAVIDCFGPADLVTMLLESPREVQEAQADLIQAFCGDQEPGEVLKRMSPIYYVEEGKSYVPFMIAHGDADPMVPFEQSRQMAARLEACGADVSLVCVENAVHEGNFWSQQIWDIFRCFLDKQAQK